MIYGNFVRDINYGNEATFSALEKCTFIFFFALNNKIFCCIFFGDRGNSQWKFNTAHARSY